MHMNKKHLYTALTITLLLCSGCSKEIENTLEELNGATIELSSVSTDPMTKAVIAGTSLTTDEAAAGIGLFLLDASGNNYGSNPTNVQYIFSGSKWTSESPLSIGNTEGNLYGYYPYIKGSNDVKAIPVASSINGTDYLYGSIAGLTSAKAKTESLTLSHALTRLRIKFKLDGSYVGSGILSSLSIEGDGIAATGTLDVTSGKITATKSTFSVSNLNATITATGITEDCLVVPGSTDDTPQAIILKFTVDGKAYKVELKNELAVKLQSGVQTDINLTINNTSVSVEEAMIVVWGDGGTKEVTVGGEYTVKIQLDSDEEGIADDVWIKNVEVVDNSVVVTARSVSDKHLKCIMSESGEFCTSQNKNSDLVYKFTISEISSDTTATIEYAKIVNISIIPSDCGSVEIIGGELYEGEFVDLKAIPGDEYIFDAWMNKDGNELISEDRKYSGVRLPSEGLSVRFKYNNPILDGVFTVASYGKGEFRTVRFTRGNLYCEISSKPTHECKIEKYQYDFKYDNFNSSPFLVSHFMWCNNVIDASKISFDSSWNNQEDFFTNIEDFTVSDIDPDEYICFALSKDEWTYLLTGRTASTVNGTTNSRYFKGCIDDEEGGDARNGMFIFPDTFTWPASVETRPKGINDGAVRYQTNTYTVTDFKRMQEAGIVFLPAAGWRDGSDTQPTVYTTNSYGYYWSSSYSSTDSANYMYFDNGIVFTDWDDHRHKACAVRLVTEVE